MNVSYGDKSSPLFTALFRSYVIKFTILLVKRTPSYRSQILSKIARINFSLNLIFKFNEYYKTDFNNSNVYRSS